MDFKDPSTWQILVIDDEPDMLEVLVMMLETRGIKTLRAASAAEALNLFNSEDINLILTDISMPDMSGWDLLTQIRANENEPDYVPVIAVTAHASTGEEHRFLEGGFDGYLSKPLRMNVLLDNISSLIEKSGRIS